MSVALALLFCLIVHGSQSKLADLVMLHEAAERDGAVCLDGSSPGFYYRKGEGSGANNVIIHLEGGGWCYDEKLCLERSKTNLGSSKKWPQVREFPSGFVSDNENVNPDFFDWNLVFVPYCDGASFTGNVDHPVMVDGYPIYFRGFRILNAVIEYMLENGMQNAERVILTGCSAGGLATYYHTDYVKSLLPSSIIFLGLADAGYFINAPNINGQYHMKELIEYAFQMQNTTFGENHECLKHHKDNQTLCLQPQFVYPYISTPIFALNSQYDTWQLKNILEVNCMPPNCNDEQMKAIQNYRDEFMKAAAPIISSTTNGAFLGSCLIHCQSLDDKHWSEVKVGGQTARETFANWYFKQTGEIKEIDCRYPCNTSC